MYQVRAHHKFETSTLVFDGLMYLSEPPSDVTALDLRTGRPSGVTPDHSTGVSAVLRAGEPGRSRSG